MRVRGGKEKRRRGREGERKRGERRGGGEVGGVGGGRARGHTINI
jgi:hypothetical protein